MPLIDAIDKPVIAESVTLSGKHIHVIDAVVIQENWEVKVRFSGVDRLVISESGFLSRSTQLGTAVDKLVIAESAFISRFGLQSPTEKVVIAEAAASFGKSNYATEYFIGAESPSGVILQTGSATYEKWQHTRVKEIQVDRKMIAGTVDPEEQGRERLSGLRNQWSLTQNLNGIEADTLWAFIQSHVGSGKSFYFYDLQNNNFFYDATGVSTNGRYLVRFVPDSFTREQYAGSRQFARFRFSYSIIEVEE